jgi:hypothetical protein
MMIAFVGGASNSAASSTSVAATYASTPGNILVAFVGVGGSIAGGVGVQDDHGQYLTVGPTGVSVVALVADTGWLYGFWGFAQPGATTYTANWATAQDGSLVIAEYSGVNAVWWGWASGNTDYNTGAGTGANISNFTTNPDAWLVAGCMNNSGFTYSGLGTRESATTASACVGLADSGDVPVVNTPITITVPQSGSSVYGALMLQLSPFAGGGYSTTNPTGATATADSFGLILFGGLAAMKSPYLGGGKASGDSGVLTGNNYLPYGQIFPRL